MVSRFLLACLVTIGTLATGEGAEVMENFHPPGGLMLSDKMLLPGEVPDLGDMPIWDVREYFKDQGVDISAEDVVLWAPASSRLFVDAEPATIYLIEDLITPRYVHASSVLAELIIVKVSPSGAREEVFKFECRTLSGATCKVSHETAEQKWKAEVEPTVGPDGLLMDVRVVFEGSKGDLKISFESFSTVKSKEQALFWKSEDRTSKERYECLITARSVHKIYSTRMEDGAAKDVLVAKIREQVKKASGSGSVVPKR